MRTMRGALFALVIGIMVGIAATLRLASSRDGDAGAGREDRASVSSRRPTASPSRRSTGAVIPPAVPAPVTMVAGFRVARRAPEPDRRQHLDPLRAGQAGASDSPQFRGPGGHRESRQMAVRRGRSARVQGAVRALLRPGAAAAPEAAAAEPRLGLHRRSARITSSPTITSSRTPTRCSSGSTTRRSTRRRSSARTPRPTSRLLRIDGVHRSHRRVARRLRHAAGRRVGDGDRQPVRSRPHRDRRHRQRQGALHRRRQLRRLHSDRRRHQSRQLRRAAAQRARRGGRHQLGDLQPDRRQHRHRLRDPDQSRQGAAAAAAREGPRDARLARRPDPEGDARDRAVARASIRRKARSSPTSSPRVRRRRPASRSATSSPSSTAIR